MCPCFQPGDVLEVENVPWKQLRKGDCIVYRKTGEPDHIVHRIVALRPAVEAQGDARKERDDAPILPSWIEGRVVARIRNERPTRVSGGLRGVSMSRFYRYAGLLEPSRNSKGGKLARLMLSVLKPIWLMWMRRAGLTIELSNTHHKPHYFTLGNRVVAVYDEESHGLSIVWPYSLVIDLAVIGPSGEGGERLDRASPLPP
jgi:hypothetical protein